MASLLARKELIQALVGREMKARYKGSSLGVLWSVLTPLFMAAIYAFFFRLLAGRAANPASIIVGVFAWQFTANCVHAGMACISGNANLVKRVSFPRLILPVSVTIAGLIDYLISLLVQVVVVGVLLTLQNQAFSWNLIWLPVFLLWHAWLNVGIAMLLGAMNVYFRDTQHLVGVFLSALFFLSPAMYDLGFVERMAEGRPWLMNVYMLNPLAGIFTGYRLAFLPDTIWPNHFWTWIGLSIPLVLTPVAALIFRRLQKDFADYV